MASNADAVGGFHLFPQLPPELRIQIWRDALPSKIGPALYPYTSSSWRRDPATGDVQLKLGDARFDVPLASVNLEARGVALAWAAKQNIKVRAVEGKHSCPVLARPFHPELDAIYVSEANWDHFVNEVRDRGGLDTVADGFPNGPSSSTSTPYRLAVPEVVLFPGPGDFENKLHEILELWSNLQVLYLVTGPRSDDPSVSATSAVDESVAWRWDIGDARGCKLAWYGDDSGNFFGGSWSFRKKPNSCPDIAQRRWMKEVCQELYEEMCVYRKKKFQVVRVTQRRSDPGVHAGSQVAVVTQQQECADTLLA